MTALNDQGYDAAGNWYSPAARRALGIPNADGQVIVGGFMVNATTRDAEHVCTCGCTPARTTDTIRNGFLVRQDGTPLGGPVMIRGGRPVVVRPTEPAYLKGQAIADAALAGDARSDAVNAANRAFWARGKLA